MICCNVNDFAATGKLVYCRAYVRKIKASGHQKIGAVADEKCTRRPTSHDHGVGREKARTLSKNG